MFAQRRQMMRAAIALVAFPAIMRMVRRGRDHHPVALFLGQDRCSGDGQAFGVALHHRRRRPAPAGATIAVHQYMRAVMFERLDRARHGQHRRPEDVDLVDLRNARDADAPAQRPRLDLRLQLGALLGAQLLGIVQAVRAIVDAQDDGGGHHRPGQRPPARLVHAGDQTGKMAMLVREVRHEHESQAERPSAHGRCRNRAPASALPAHICGPARSTGHGRVAVQGPSR